MQTPALPDDEASRLAALRSLNILDTRPEERFDRLTRLAKRLFGVPIVLISLVDENRQWFKSCHGLDVSETPRDVSFCGHAILGNDILHIADATLDERFRDNPLVTGAPHIRFYAGCPLTIRNQAKIGTLCLIDSVPRSLDAEERQLLRDLARMAEEEITAVQLATTDELTQLSNRRGFAALAQHVLAMCARLDKPATMFYLDLDGMKPINDRFGHAEGDRALVAFAQALQHTFRDSDAVARLGGDEFAALMMNCTLEQAQLARDRLQATVDIHNRSAERGYDLRFSVGTVAYDAARHTGIDVMLQDADALMYEHKRRLRRA